MKKSSWLYSVMKMLETLMKLEFEDTWRWPLLEITVIVTILTNLSNPQAALSYGARLFYLYFYMLMFTSIIFAKTFAASIEKGNIKLLLSYPVERRYIFTAKFLLSFLILYTAFFSSYLASMMLGGGHTSMEWEVTLNAVGVTLFLLLLYQCSVATLISIATSRGMLAAIISILALWRWGAPVWFLSPDNSSVVLFRYLSGADVSIVDAGLALITLLLIPLTVLSIAYLLFCRVMEFD